MVVTGPGAGEATTEKTRGGEGTQQSVADGAHAKSVYEATTGSAILAVWRSLALGKSPAGDFGLHPVVSASETGGQPEPPPFESLPRQAEVPNLPIGKWGEWRQDAPVSDGGRYSDGTFWTMQDWTISPPLGLWSSTHLGDHRYYDQAGHFLSRLITCDSGIPVTMSVANPDGTTRKLDAVARKIEIKKLPDGGFTKTYKLKDGSEIEEINEKIDAAGKVREVGLWLHREKEFTVPGIGKVSARHEVIALDSSGKFSSATYSDNDNNEYKYEKEEGDGHKRETITYPANRAQKFTVPDGSTVLSYQHGI